jgi:SAM-dependent methyltransferase
VERGFSGKTILELGPLEGGHTYMFEQRGATHVTSVEANTRAYLRCLITKELLQIRRAAFLCGDFVEYLKDDRCPTFDLCVASGVLYHMRNPVELIELLARRCRSHLFLWTHYYDAAQAADKASFSGSHSAEHQGFGHTLHRYEYQAALDWSGFCGGTAPYAHWLTRGDIVGALQHFGFDIVSTGFDTENQSPGPSFALVARRCRPSGEAEQAVSFGAAAQRWGSKEVAIETVTLLGPDGPSQVFHTGDRFVIRIAFAAGKPVSRPVFGISIRTLDGILVTGPNTQVNDYSIDRVEGKGFIEYRLDAMPLLPGTYTVAAAVYDQTLTSPFDHWEGCAGFVVRERPTGERFGLVSLRGKWAVRKSVRSYSSARWLERFRQRKS